MAYPYAMEKDRPSRREDDRLAVQEWGQGVPAVFVHGSLTTGEETWEGERPLASEGYRLVVLDRRGYGGSPNAAGEDFLPDGEDVAELLGDGAHFVGHSYGGLPALVAAERRRDAVLSLTLIAAFGLCADHPAVASFVAEARDLWAQPDLTDRQFLEAFLGLVGESPDEIPDELLQTWTARVPVLRKGRLPWEAELPLDHLTSRPVPTLVISGDHQPRVQRRL